MDEASYCPDCKGTGKLSIEDAEITLNRGGENE